MPTADEINAQNELEKTKAAAAIEAAKAANEKAQTDQSHTQRIVMLGILGVLLLIIFGTVASSGGEFLLKLKDVEIARGLITFLVAITAISIALVSSIYVMASNENKDEIKERFSYAKDVLATLVGILGTVLGFYFGSLNHPGDTPLSIDIILRGKQLLGHISGAASPYNYSISFAPDSGKSIIQNISKDGWLTEAIPEGISKETSIQIDIVDAKDRKLSKTIKYSPEVKAGSSGANPASTNADDKKDKSVPPPAEGDKSNNLPQSGQSKPPSDGKINPTPATDAAKASPPAVPPASNAN